ncbi:MAG: CDP-glucose 4,6-dehydratase [Proteobacteria bacterium]|nr:CDP-glucose 4,6-dehydratase [Pseudomonadota bacterium]
MFNRTFAGKKVLVTGHTGFKGTWLSRWLIDLGAEVTGYAFDPPTAPSHFEVLGLGKHMQDIRGDIGDAERLQSAFQKSKPDVVFHLAAQPIVSLSISNPVENYATNVMGTVQVLEAIRKTESVRAAVMITSDKCYENVEWEFGYRENDHLGGKDPYSASKACAEIVFHSYFRTYFQGNSGIKLATGRAGNVIGGGDWAKDRIIPDNARAWGSGEVPVIRSPHATRPWQHVLEPLSGYIWLAAQLLNSPDINSPDKLNGESFNFGPGADTNATVEDLLKAVVKHWQGKTWRVEASKLTGKEAGLLKLNCDKALARLGWRPTLKFDETVQFTADWYKSFYESSPKSACDLTAQQIRRFEAAGVERGANWAKS